MSTDSLELLLSERHRRQREEEAELLSGRFRDFVPAAWPHIKKQVRFLHNWHIDAICDHLEAVTRGDIQFLQIWVPRVSMKSMLVSVMWPAWEWTQHPGLRYFTASYELGLSGRFAAMSRNLMLSPWYRARWGDRFDFISDATKYLVNNQGGTRLASATGSTALGEHGDRVIFDDPINAGAADADSKVTLQNANDWYEAIIEGSKTNDAAAEVIVMQRLHEQDFAGHALELEPDAWTILCLPERKWLHPYAWRGDPRKEGELLWPAKRGEVASRRMEKKLRVHRAWAQMQQWPTSKEGEILKRHWWRFYHPDLFKDEKLKNRRPRFTTIVQSVDTPLKDKESNDLVAIQAWGMAGADRYLLDLKKGHMNFHQAERAIIEQARYVRQLYPRCVHHVLIENAGYGVELIVELKRTLTGVVKITRGTDGDKELRAEAAAADLESGNCYLPGYREGQDELSMPDETRNAADITDFIDSCAIFPNGRHDDDVDAWSQAMNYCRLKQARRARTISSFRVKR